MANSELYGKIIGRVPTPILDYIKKYMDHNKGLESMEGYQHAQNLLNNPELSYSLAKKIKHFFDDYNHLQSDRNDFELHGGIRMKKYIEHLLTKVRDGIVRSKQVKGLTSNNQFRKSHNKTFDKAPQIDNLSNFAPNKQQNYISENEMTKREASIGFIFNKEGKILLLQRARNDDWMPMKWATLGGGVEAGEDPTLTLKREALEEANAKLINIQYIRDKVEDGTHVYVYRAICDNPDEINVCHEHEKFKWVDVEDVPKYNTVPDFLKDLNDILTITK